MARCRRNVDNFLEACRRIGVDEVSSSDTYTLYDPIYKSVEVKYHGYIIIRLWGTSSNALNAERFSCFS